MREVARELARIPRAVAVLGNHDWRAAGPAMGWALRDAGVRLLENEAVAVRDGLWVAGMADPRHRFTDLEAALEEAAARMPRSCWPSHDPDVFPDVPDRVALTVAGHLHGGQVNVPILRRAVLPTRYGDRYLAGHVVEGGRHLYVSAGLGTAGLPLRLRRPPEVPVLRSQPRAQDSSRVTCSSRRPVAGSVCTSSVGPGRAAAHAAQLASNASSTHASGRSGPVADSIAASFQWRAPRPVRSRT